MRLEKASFGPVLRAARERRGVTLRQLSAETKLSVELWAGLEESDLSGWPTKVYARSYVRDYALRVGLDADEVVNEFCRLFPEWGDRRAEGTMREHAAIVSHDLEWQDLPTKEPRRASDRAAAGSMGFVGRHRVRILAVAFDTKVMFAAAGVGVLMGFPFWPSLAVGAAAYTLAATVLAGRSLGLTAAEWTIKHAKSIRGARRLVSRAERA